MRYCRFLICFLVVFLLVCGCTSHKRQVVPFKMPAAFPNATKVAGATVAARAFSDTQEAKRAFGWDIRAAGLSPVQVIFDNLGEHSVEIVPSQTFLIDVENNLWPILNSSLAYDRVAEKTDMTSIAKSAVKPGILSGVAGAILGAAIGIVSGQNVGAAAGKGAVLGAAIGATIGGAQGASSGEARVAISEDLEKKSLENKAIGPHSIAHGFIFFPGEAKGAVELRLQLRIVETGDLYMIRLAL
ncbi:MAG: hypothetical protein JRD47_05595 [Deltaproteobacteria bacterium]|nr:hypothetical protein [Deltaproteobacteria bacterium]MBW2601382.1 hypothetical protein [Deltaproteobacteria bacterium]